MVGKTWSGIRLPPQRQPAAAAADLCRPGTEADALEQWGLAMASAGDGAGAAEKLEAAAGVYRGHGAGAGGLERLRRDARTRGVGAA
jgi:hypothetical protein